MEKILKDISYRLQFNDGATFMASSLSNHVNNLAEGIYRIECKFGLDNKKCETCRIKYKDCDCFLGYKKFNDNLIKHKCLFCNINFQVKILLMQITHTEKEFVKILR